MTNFEENGIVCHQLWSNLMRKTLANGDQQNNNINMQQQLQVASPKQFQNCFKRASTEKAINILEISIKNTFNLFDEQSNASPPQSSKMMRKDINKKRVSYAEEEFKKVEVIAEFMMDARES